MTSSDSTATSDSTAKQIGMGMHCKKKTMIRLRNVWSMKWRVPGLEVDQRKFGEILWKKDCQAHKLNREDAMDRNRWRKQIRDDWWSWQVWVGACFFWFRLNRVTPVKIQIAVKQLFLCVCVWQRKKSCKPDATLPHEQLIALKHWRKQKALTAAVEKLPTRLILFSSITGFIESAMLLLYLCSEICNAATSTIKLPSSNVIFIRNVATNFAATGKNKKRQDGLHQRKHWSYEWKDKHLLRHALWKAALPRYQQHVMDFLQLPAHTQTYRHVGQSGPVVAPHVGNILPDILLHKIDKIRKTRMGFFMDPAWSAKP